MADHVREFLFPISLLRVIFVIVRVPILAGGMRFLSLLTDILFRDVEHLVLWAIFFFSLKGVGGRLYLLQLAFESQLCLEFISAIPSPGSFLDGGCH